MSEPHKNQGAATLTAVLDAAAPASVPLRSGECVRRAQGDTGVLVRRDTRDTETHGWWLIRLDDTYSLNGGAPVHPEVWEHEDRLMPAEGKDPT